MPDPVTVVICTRNRADSLPDAVESVLREDPNELIIVDQSDNPESEDYVRALRDRRILYIHSEFPGLSRAYNTAIQSAHHELMAFTDDDCVVPPGWLTAIRRVSEANPDAGLIYGQVLAGTRDVPPGGYIPELRFEKPAKFVPGGPFRVFGMGANFAARRSALQAVGGFDDAMGGGGLFKSSQDFDMQLRMWRAGTAVLIHPDIAVDHFGMRTRDQWPQTARAYGYGDGAFFVKHLRLGDRTVLRLFIQKVARELATPPARLIRRRPYSPEYARSFVQGFWAGLRHPVVKETRRYTSNG